MYRVTIYNGTTSTVIHEPSADPDDAHLYECSLVQGSSGEIDSLSFTITPNNPGYEELYSYSTFIEVVDLRSKGEAAIFSGRVLSVSPQMEESGLVYKNIVCEDRLGYLCDSIQPYTTMNTYTVREFLELLLDNHNSQVEDYKKMYVGTVSFETSSGNVTKSLNYQTTWEAITGKLLELGGEIQLYTLNGLLYIDYVTELGTMGDQTIEIAKNMRSLEQDKSPTDIITRLIPLGDYLDEQTGESDDRERLTIASVNGGKTYIDDDEAIAEYGIIAGTVVWEDVTIASNLLEKGQQWLKDQSVNETVSLSAYDLYAAGIDPDVIERYNYYLTYNPLIGVNKWYRVAQKKTNVIDPTDVSFTMGDQSTSLSSTVKRTGQDAADAAAAINANLSKTVATLIAGNAIIQYLQATVAEIETLYVDKEYVNELVAAEIEAAIINVGFLTADSAVITDLTAFAASIYTLLGGEGSFGELETAHLTADNVVIDTAVIVNAVAGTLLADLITAEFINTDLIKVGSTDGTLWIDGSTILIYDENGNPRVQIGLDELGDYNLALWDEDGNCMWNASGATEYGINDGVIRNDMVADDAAIAGSKLDIESIVSIINENGDYVFNAGSVMINDQTLDAWYVQVTEQLEGLEGLTYEGLISVEPWFCLWTSDTEPPEESAFTTLCGQSTCGVAVCGLVGETEWVNYDLQTEPGLYKWVKWKGYYEDGHTEWSIPYCLTDGYLRSTVGVLQTQLEVVQGWISERVWYTEIMDDIDKLIETDVWSELNIWLNGIELEVGEMRSEFTDQYESLEAQVAGIYIDVSSITSRVESTEQQIGNLEYSIENLSMEGVSYFETYFCLWDSALEAPPDEGETKVIEQTFSQTTTFVSRASGSQVIAIDVIEGYTPISIVSCTSSNDNLQVNNYVLDAEKNQVRVIWHNTSSASVSATLTVVVEYESDVTGAWTPYEPQPGEGEYKWVRYLLYYEDGHTEWTTPYCLTEQYSRTQISEIVQTATSITERVSSVEEWLGSGYSSSESLNTLIEQYVDEGKAEIIIEVSRDYALKTDLDDVVEYTDAQIKAVADDTSASIDIVTKALESAQDEWSVSVAEIRTYVDAEMSSISLEVDHAVSGLEDEIASNRADIELYVDDSISKMSLSVSGGLGGTASITLTTDGSTLSTANVDLSKVREAFRDDETAITIAGGAITFVSNMLIVESTQFQLDKDGNATFSGHLSAPSGTIGGFEIGSTALYNPSTKSSLTSAGDGVYLGTDGIALGETFRVNSSGYLLATSGQFGNTYVNTAGIYSGSHTSFTSTADGFFLGPDGISIGGYTSSALGSQYRYNFHVDSSGSLVCNSGTIGSWTINGHGFTNGPSSYGEATAGTFMGYEGWWQYGSNTTHIKMNDGTMNLGYGGTDSGYLSGYQKNTDNNKQCLRMAGVGGIVLCGEELIVYQGYPSVSASITGYLGATTQVTVLTSTSGATRTLSFVNGIFNG